MPITSPSQVEQRPAGVAGVDRHVGLDERHIAVAGQRARFGRDDAGGDAVLEAERRTDGDHPFAGPGRCRVAEAHGRQVLRIDAQHGDVGQLVHADNLGLEFALVGQLDGDFVGIG
jgi:hypothetical protein